MSTRVYVPASLDLLAAWSAAGEVPAGEPTGAERVVAASDDEDDEYDALEEAAEVSAGLRAGASGHAGRRVVVVAEVGGGDAAAMALPWRTVVAVHADTAPDADADDELGWYATQEVPYLLAERD